jgi:hypothetical protein
MVSTLDITIPNKGAYSAKETSLKRSSWGSRETANPDVTKKFDHSKPNRTRTIIAMQ